MNSRNRLSNRRTNLWFSLRLRFYSHSEGPFLHQTGDITKQNSAMLGNGHKTSISHIRMAVLPVYSNHVALVFIDTQYCIIPRMAVDTASTASAFYLGTNAADVCAVAAFYSGRHSYSRCRQNASCFMLPTATLLKSESVCITLHNSFATGRLRLEVTYCQR